MIEIWDRRTEIAALLNGVSVEAASCTSQDRDSAIAASEIGIGVVPLRQEMPSVVLSGYNRSLFYKPTPTDCLCDGPC